MQYCCFSLFICLVYPSSNGYNSYMDRDTTSIGGIEKPLQPTNQLFVFTVIMDVIAVLLSLIISPLTAACIFIYIMFSRLYSYRKIRLKQYALIGYLVVILNQGGLIFFTVFNAANKDATCKYTVAWNCLRHIINWRLLSHHSNLPAQRRCSMIM